MTHHDQRGRDQGRRDQRDPDPEILTIDPTRLGLPSGPQSEVAQITDCLLRARNYANVLAPAMQITHMPVDHVITFMVVLFPIDGIATFRDRDGVVMANKQQSNGVWYATDGGELAHHRAALDMLGQAAGVNWVHDKCGRTDDRSRTALWSYRMTLAIKGLDGRTREVSREYELDLRGSGSELSPAAAKAGRGLRNARIHGAQLCESKAANRAMRAALGLRAYTVEEAARPFVIPVLQWVPDASDPMIRRMVAAKELGIVNELFGAEAGGGTHLVDAERVIEHDPRPARAAAHDAAPKQRQLPAPDDTPDGLDGLQDQLERNRQRERVPVQRRAADADAPWDQQPGPAPLSDDDLDRYCDAKGWDRPPGQVELRQLRSHVSKGKGRADYDRTMGVRGGGR